MKSIPYFICDIPNNILLTKVKQKIQMFDCKITNNGIIPIEKSYNDKPIMLNELIDIIIE